MLQYSRWIQIWCHRPNKNFNKVTWISSSHHLLAEMMKGLTVSQTITSFFDSWPYLLYIDRTPIVFYFFFLSMINFVLLEKIVLRIHSTQKPQYSKIAVLKICSTQKPQFLNYGYCKQKIVQKNVDSCLKFSNHLSKSFYSPCFSRGKLR